MKNKLLLLLLIAITPMLQAQENSCLDAENAIHISGSGTYTVGDINGESIPDTCVGSITTPLPAGEWFAYTPSAGFNTTISSDLAINGDKDTRLQIYIGDCGNLECYAGDDDSGVFTGTNGSSPLSVETFIAVPGETYYIVCDARYSTGNNFTFEITEDPLPPLTFEDENFSTTGTRRGVVDMNGDFLDDILTISQAGSPPEATAINIYYQQVDGSFSAVSTYGITTTYAPTWSLAAGDYNADGYNDLVFGSTTGVAVVDAVSSGTDYSLAYSNNDVFTQRTNFVDINNDGDLDIFVCHDQAPNVYYINDGSNNLDFYEGADPNGVPQGLGVYPSGGNYGSVWIDYDNDHDMDMFIAKCGGVSDVERRKNQLFRNDSSNGNASFADISVSVGLDDPMQTWSSAWADFDNDGDMDLFIGSYSIDDDHKLMKNRSEVPLDSQGLPLDGLPLFEDISAASGVQALTKTGVENEAHDFNNDGYIDIISNGKILINNGDLTFTEDTSLSLPSIYAIGDLNNDGYLDLHGFKKFYNVSNTYLQHNWLKIYTVGVESNKNGIGARIEITSPGIGTQIRDVRSGEGFRYMGSLNTHFGIGSDTSISTVKVFWPSGEIDLISNPPINQPLTIVEGDNTLTTASAEKSDLILYPNPTENILNLNATYNLSDTIYSVFDINGRRIMNAKLESEIIDVSNLAPGTYLLRLFSQDKVTTQRFIKK